MPIYVKYDGVKGTATAKGHEGSKGWIELQSFQWGVGRGISMAVGRGANREASAPSVSEVVVTKLHDESSPDFTRESLTGDGKKVVVHFVKTGENELLPYLEITLENTLVSGYSISSGGDRPMESLSLNFTKIEYKAIAGDEKGKLTTPTTVMYDLKTGTKS
jgi:type VI secretion system secreted protein Hcp